jgi:hypothetical protein
VEKLLNEKLYNLNSSMNIITSIKSRRMRWAGRLAPMGEKCIKIFGKETSRKETTRKTSVYVEILY